MVGEGPRASRFEYDGNGVDRSLLRLVEFYVFWTITYFLHSRMARTPRSLVWLRLLKKTTSLFFYAVKITARCQGQRIKNEKKKSFCYLFSLPFPLLSSPWILDGFFYFLVASQAQALVFPLLTTISIKVIPGTVAVSSDQIFINGQTI